MSLYIAGINGMVGSAIAKLAASRGEVVLGKSSKDMNFTDRNATFLELETTKPEYLIIAAAKVGGIGANSDFPVDFLSLNLQIQTNLLDAAHKAQVKKVLFLGSSCIYPKMAPQPLKEEYLLSGYLEETNQPYAIAKIAGIELCDGYRAQYGCNFISAMPTNLYGPNDNYDLEKSHVLPAMLRKFIMAKRNNEPTVTIWGSGTPKREFLHVNDLADACLYLMQEYNEKGLVNIGTGVDVTILELAQLVKEITGYDGEIVLDASKPDGTPRKLMDVGKMTAAGWKAKINLRSGIQMVYQSIKDEVWDA
jgi:GDP-L-fucose synthase